MNSVTELTISKVAKLKTKAGSLNMRVFRLRGNRSVAEIPVLFVGSCLDDAVLRIRSACITSEIFGDQRCDCAEQLRGALHDVIVSRNGLLIYAPADEGYGNGLLQKVNSFWLMDESRMTAAEAYDALGCPRDARTYWYVAPILRTFGVRSVLVDTSNEAKLASIRAAAVEIRTGSVNVRN